MALENFGGNFGRALRILRVLGEHDATFVFDRFGLPGWMQSVLRIAAGRAKPEMRALRPGQRLAAAVQEMGPSFVKFGQTLSTRPDVVGDELAADLALLRDRLPPFPGAEARAIIERELDQSDRKSTRLNSSHTDISRMPSSA